MSSGATTYQRRSTPALIERGGGTRSRRAITAARRNWFHDIGAPPFRRTISKGLTSRATVALGSSAVSSVIGPSGRTCSGRDDVRERRTAAVRTSWLTMLAMAFGATVHAVKTSSFVAGPASLMTGGAST